MITTHLRMIRIQLRHRTSPLLDVIKSAYQQDGHKQQQYKNRHQQRIQRRRLMQKTKGVT